MASPGDQQLTDVRLSKKGLESPSQKGKVQGGFGDTKKVVALAVLGIVALGVVGYQFLGGGGPAPAEAKMVNPAAGGAAPALPPSGASQVSAVLERMDQPPAKKGEDGLSVEQVEALVRKFDTYVEERQIPLSNLRVNPFQVVRVAKVEAPEDVKARAEANAEAEAEARRRRILQAAAQLKLGAVLIAGTTRSAIIEGRLYHVGDVVEGMRVAAIRRDHVTLAYENEQVDLRLRPEQAMP